jgi:hypothetical protein
MEPLKGMRWVAPRGVPSPSRSVSLSLCLSLRDAHAPCSCTHTLIICASVPVPSGCARYALGPQPNACPSSTSAPCDPTGLRLDAGGCWWRPWRDPKCGHPSAPTPSAAAPATATGPRRGRPTCPVPSRLDRAQLMRGRTPASPVAAAPAMAEARVSLPSTDQPTGISQAVEGSSGTDSRH